MLLVVVSVIIVGALAKAQLARGHPAPGRLVDVGGYRLHLHCLGEGEPTIVLEAGQPESSLTWSLVQAEIGRSTRTCSYDRAGLGWSDPSPSPRALSQMVLELRALLTEAEVPGPYVLVGHSFGGLIVRSYAQRYPADVSGLVLVDPTHEDQYARASPTVRAALLDLQEQTKVQLRAASILADAGLLALLPGLVPLRSELPEDARRAYAAVVARDPKHIRSALAEIAANETSFSEARAHRAEGVGDIPMVVIEATSHPIPGLSAEEQAGFESLWSQLQRELASLSTRGRVVRAEGDHYVHLRDPELVVNAIREILGST